MRHANIAESLSSEEASEYLKSDSGTYATDGSIFEHSMFSGGDHVESAWSALNFLNQEHKMYVVQAKLDADWTIARTAFGSFTLNLGNVFQYTHNKGVDAQLYPGTGSKTPNSPVYYRKKWERGFRDELADYVFIGFTYKF